MSVCSSWHYIGKRAINCPSSISTPEYYDCDTHSSSCLLAAVLFRNFYYEKFYLMNICHCQIPPTPPAHSKELVETVKTNRELSFWYVWVSFIAYLNGKGIKVIQHHVVGLWEQCRVTLETKQNHAMTLLSLCVGFCSLEVLVGWLSSIK